MKAFRFTLEAVQTVRERAAHEALEVYARALKLRATAEAELAKAEALLREHLLEWRGKMANNFAPSEMLQRQHARTMLEARRDDCGNRAREAVQAATKALAALQLARQQSDVVERFHDRQRHAFNLAVLKEEQQLADELAGARRDSAQKGFSHA